MVVVRSADGSQRGWLLLLDVVVVVVRSAGEWRDVLVIVRSGDDDGEKCR